MLKYSRHQNYRFFYCRFPKKIFNLGLVVSPPRTWFHDAPCIFKEIRTGFNTFFYSYPFLSCSLSLYPPSPPFSSPDALSPYFHNPWNIFNFDVSNLCVWFIFCTLAHTPRCNRDCQWRTVRMYEVNYIKIILDWTAVTTSSRAQFH